MRIYDAVHFHKDGDQLVAEISQFGCPPWEKPYDPHIDKDGCTYVTHLRMDGKLVPFYVVGADMLPDGSGVAGYKLEAFPKGVQSEYSHLRVLLIND